MRVDRTLPHRFRWFTAAVIVALAGPVCARAAGQPPGVELRGLDGKPFSLESLRGRVVVLDFWAPWCIPCRKSFPFLQSLQEKHGTGGLSVVGLTLDNDLPAIESFLDEIPVRFPIVRDPSGRSGEALGVVSMPTTFLLDREGRIVARFEGGSDAVHRGIERSVATLLAGGALPNGAGVRVAAGLEATGIIRAWRRGFLADSIMSLDGDPLTRMLREHIHSSKEGAAGDGGAAGGGCGCN
jgi:thiol-disulfide isomerase/thioredoxin